MTGADSNTGISPVEWGSWNTTWRGTQVTGRSRSRTRVNTRRIGRTRTRGPRRRRGRLRQLEPQEEILLFNLQIPQLSLQQDNKELELLLKLLKDLTLQI